jgi:hypothetical protein
MRRKAYDSDPVPMTLTADKVRQGTRDYVPIYTNPQLGLDTNRFYNIKELLDFIASEESSKKLPTQGGQELNYLPTNKVFIPVDSATVVNNGTVPKYLADKMVKGGIPWTINKSYIMKNDLLIFDILATNNWKRPIYFAITVGDDAYMDLQDYFQIEGLTYRLVPIKNNNYDGQTGRVLIDKMYDNLMNKFHWGGMETPGIYMDENNIRMTMNLRNNFARLAEELLKYNEKEKALKVLDKCMMVMPKENIPYNYFMLPIVECYYKAGETTKGNKLAQELADIYTDDMQFYLTLKGKDSESVDNEKQQCMGVLQRILMMTKQYKQDALNKKIESDFTKFSTQYTRG